MAKESKKQGGSLMSSVKTRLIIIMLVIAAVPILITTIVSYNNSISEAKENMETLNSVQCNLVQHDIKAIVDEHRYVLENIAKSEGARYFLKEGGDPEETAQWLADIDASFGDGNTLAMSNTEGQQLIRTVGDCVEVGDRDYFTEVKGGKDFYVSDIIVSRSSGKRICTFSAPIYDIDGTTFLGVIQRNYDLSIMHQLCADEVEQEKQDIFILDNEGMVIAHSGKEITVDNPDDQSGNKAFIQSRTQDSGSYDSSYQGGNWRISYQKEPTSGWVVVIASDKGVGMRGAKRTAIFNVCISIVLLIIVAIVAVVLARSFTAPIFVVNETLAELADGRFVPIEVYQNRKDEFGEMVAETNVVISKLKEIVDDIKRATNHVSTSASELAQTAQQISSTTDDVSNAVQDVAKGATEQADTIQRATENVNTLSDAIQSVADNAENLANTAASMNDNSTSSAEQLQRLTGSMQTMGTAMDEISESIHETNAAVENISRKVDGITSIASQTNLLALNASIEAARAGEAGKGFAVVAEEIGQLATDSANTANEIREVMKHLIETAEGATNKAKEVTDIGNSVQDVLKETVESINMLIDGVGITVDGVTTISGISQECAASKAVIVDAMDSLSAISEENAASTEETSASMQELNATVNELSASADTLNDVARTLEQDVDFFKD